LREAGGLLVYVQWWAGSVTAAAELLTLGVTLADGLADVLADVLADGVCDVLAAAELGDFPPLNRKNAPAMRPSTTTAATPPMVHFRTWASCSARLTMRRW